MLLAQDLYILLKLTLLDQEWTFQSLSNELGISSSQIHAGLKRAEAGNLYFPRQKKPSSRGLAEFVIHGVKYVYPAKRGGISRGMPTSFAGPPLNKVIVQAEELVPVWPWSKGTHRGYLVEPLHKGAPVVCQFDQAFYELLCLVDAIREGRARERELAIRGIQQRLGKEG